MSGLDGKIIVRNTTNMNELIRLLSMNGVKLSASNNILSAGEIASADDYNISDGAISFNRDCVEISLSPDTIKTSGVEIGTTRTSIVGCDYIGFGESQEYTILYYYLTRSDGNTTYIGFNKMDSCNIVTFDNRNDLIDYYKRYRNFISDMDESKLMSAVHDSILGMTTDNIVVFGTFF